MASQKCNKKYNNFFNYKNIIKIQLTNTIASITHTPQTFLTNFFNPLHQRLKIILTIQHIVSSIKKSDLPSPKMIRNHISPLIQKSTLKI